MGGNGDNPGCLDVKTSSQASEHGGRKNPQPMKIEADYYYPEPDTAALLGVSPATLRRRRQTRTDLPFCKYGRRVFYRGADIIASLEASRRISTVESR